VDERAPSRSGRRSSGLRDLAKILAGVAVVFAVGAGLGVFDRIEAGLRSSPAVDELLAFAALTIAGIAIFAVRRWRQAEEEQLLRVEAESRFREIVERVPAVVYVWDGADAPGTAPARYISPQIEHLLGYTPAQWLGDPAAWAERVHDDDLARVLQAWDDAVARGGAFSQEYRVRRAEGTWAWLRDDAAPVRSGPRGAPIYQGVLIDVSDQVEARRKVDAAEERFRSLVEELPVVVYTDDVDDVSTALYLSPGYEALTGYTVEERLAEPDLWTRMLHPDDRAWVLRESERTNRTGEPFDVEYRIVTRDGRTAWLHDRAVLVEGAEGRIWQGVLMDVTDRRRAEDALARRDAVLQAAAFAAERFLTDDDPLGVIDEVLERLGRAGEAARAHVWRNDGVGAATSLVRTWHEPGWADDDPSPVEGFPWVGRGFERWRDVLSRGQEIHGRVAALPDAERAVPEGGSLPIRAVLREPISVDGRWWGHLGLDRCASDELWSDAEVEALSVVANTFGAAIARQQATARLGEAEERYRFLVEKMPAIAYVDEFRPGESRTWPTTYISPQIEAILGFSPDEWRRDPTLWDSLIHPDDRERAAAADAEHYTTGTPLDVELRVRTRDGGWRWMRDRSVLIRDDDGNPRWSQGILLDVTERKVAEIALDEAEQRYRSLIETIPAVTYVDAVDDSMATLYVSPQVTSALGYTPAEWIADQDLWRQRLHADDADRVLDAIAAHNRSGAPYDVEYRFQHGDGRWLWVRDQAVVIHDEHGLPLFSQGVIFDVTDQKAAEAHLREAEERFRGIVEHVPAGIYVDRPDGSMQTIYASPQIEAITGIPVREWVEDAGAWERAIDPDEREAVVESYLAAIREGRPWSAEYRMRTRDGRTIWVHDETVFLHDEDERPSLVQGVLFDVTERKLAEEALRESERREREAAERLRALDDMKNTFLAAVSHELRSPLTSILGLSLTLERTPDMEGAERADLLGRMAANATKLDRLLKDLLDIDRLQRGIVEPQYRTTDVGALARRVAEQLEVLDGREVSVEAAPIVMPVDPAKVERIVENLLTNAARHTTADVRIWLEIRPHEHGVLLVVEDDGPGVAAELKAAIFEPFRQGPTASPHAPGTGVGLSLVARFAELHGGRAWVDDRQGGGASFRVYLPAPGRTAHGGSAEVDATGTAGEPLPTG
jgi:PAS domain S-box-containing protein